MASRVRTALSLYAFAVLGLFLLVAPWTPVWQLSTRALLPDAVEAWTRAGWVRGLVSGLGALDLAVALQVAADLWREMHETSPGKPD